MSVLLLYLLLLKATLTTFSGMSSLPLVHADFVDKYKVLSSQELNRAVAVSRMAPGPNGLYLVSVGYTVAGLRGAAVALAALMTPSFLIIAVLQFVGRNADRPLTRRVTQAITLASGGLLVRVLIPMAQTTIGGPFTLAIALATFLVLVLTRIDTIWVVLGAGAAGLIAQAI
jgi:chromate transporter